MATYDPASYGRQFDSAWANWSPVDYQGGLPPELLRAIQQHASNSTGHLDSDGNWVNSPNPNGHIVSPDGRWQLSVLPTAQGPEYQLNDLVRGGPGEAFYSFDSSGKLKEVKTGAKAMSGGQGLAMVGLSALGMGALGQMIGGAGAAGAAGGGLASDIGMMYAGADAAAASSLGGGYMGGLGGTALGGGTAAMGAGAGGFGGGGGLGTLGADFGGNWFGALPQGSGYGLSAAGELAPASTFGGSAIGGGLGALGSSGPGWMDIFRNGASQVMGNSGGGGGGNNWLGLATTALGALGGAQGQNASNTTSRSMDPRMDALFYGDLAPRTAGVLGAQLPMAMGAGNQMLQVGSGLLGRTAPDTPTNPYLQGRADDLQRRTADLLAQNNLGIQGNAVATGGLGGSRQGVAQGLAASKAADYLQGNLAGMYGQAYDQDQNRLRQDWTLGAGLMNQGLNTQFQPMQNAASIYSPFTGFGSTTQSAESGGGLMGGLGGALGAAQFAKNMGFFGNNNTGSSSGGWW